MRRKGFTIILTLKCPSNEIFFLHRTGKLSEKVSAGFGEHLKICPRCREKAEFNQALRDVPKKAIPMD